MLEFIQLLNQRYQTILSQREYDVDKISYQQRIDQLVLTEAFIRRGQYIKATSSQPLQISVVGPTQAGKSSIVNVLLDSNLANVSPLAGHTIHPQGYAQRDNLAECEGLQRYFGRFQRMSQDMLPRDRHDCYSVSQVDSKSAFLPSAVLWDTPDFDSIDSSVYREGVLRAIALADVIVLVVSKEKYADQSVWDMMSVLEALHQPTIICLNKLSEGSEDLLLESLKEKWSLVRKDSFPTVVPLYYQKNIGLPLWPNAHRDVLKKLISQVDRKKQGRYEQELVQTYWQEWLEPIISEHQAAAEWQKMVAVAIEQALQNYQRDYLNHPHHYETFQHALAELLTLLEIPGLAGFLTGARKVLTWPIRKIMNLGQKRLHIADSSQELVLLNQIAEHTLIQLMDQLMDKAESEQQRLWWKEVSGLLRRQRQDLLQAFTQAALSYHLAFQQDVEKTAQRLYHKLEEQPLLLNSLRATRVTADATAIALTLHMGGIGVHDLVFAPAMLTMTTLLTESAMGSYMHRVENDLKQQQLHTVKQTLFIENIGKVLAILPEQLSSLTHFNISDAQVKAVEQQFTEKRHGLRLLRFS
ncbi:MAG: 50S ribosome-binding GTPase [Methylococcales bacterium]|nr:50S ribosome-binding GTPase [Methylococcales bacterium]